MTDSPHSIAEVWLDMENDIEELEKALELDPANRALLAKLLKLYQDTGQLEKLVDTLLKDIKSYPGVRSSDLYAIAQICINKLNDHQRAVELLNEALDLNPGFLEALERIDKILTGLKEWKQLELSYRKMLHRIAGTGNNDLEFSLWHALGLIHRDPLGDPTAAVEAFRMASRLRPEDVQEHLILAELYETLEKTDEAVAEHQRILEVDPTNINARRGLSRLQGIER